MSIDISLYMTPTVDTKQWDSFWCDSLRLLQKFPLKLVRESDYNSQHGIQKIWTNELTASDKNGEYWEIAGDAESLAFCESFRLYRNIEYYQRKWSRLTANNPSLNNDPLFCSLQDYAGRGDIVALSGIHLLNGRTQGYPYHHALAAVASLAEHRFPIHAIAWGDLGPNGCYAVQHWLSSLYGETILSPICLDAVRLWNRIEGVCSDVAVTTKRFEKYFLGSVTQCLHQMFAKSQETTMQTLAKKLLYYNSITIGFAEQSKAFLAVTNDLDLLLDLIDLRNSLAQNGAMQKETEPSIIKLEDVLMMLVMGYVTYSKSQKENIHTLDRWLNMEGSAIQKINATMIKMSLPITFNYSCSEKDLLETFIRREPTKQTIFYQVYQDSLKNAREKEGIINGFFQTIKTQADARMKAYTESKSKAKTFDSEENDTITAVNDFEQFMDVEALIHSELKEPLSEVNVAVVGHYFGFHVREMLRVAPNSRDAQWLYDPTGTKQRNVLMNILRQNDVRLLKEAMLELEKTDDIEIIKMFAMISPVVFVEQFRCSASAVFNEGFDLAWPTLWHILNKPTWWPTFREHRNDEITNDDSET